MGKRRLSKIRRDFKDDLTVKVNFPCFFDGKLCSHVVEGFMDCGEGYTFCLRYPKELQI